MFSLRTDLYRLPAKGRRRLGCRAACHENENRTRSAAAQVVGRLEGLAGGRLLALGDEGGGLSVADLRMLGGTHPDPDILTVNGDVVALSSPQCPGSCAPAHAAEHAVPLTLTQS